MIFKEFIDTISDYEYFSYTHIMEIPESSFEYSKTLNNEQWNLIYREKQSIALCCCIENNVHIIFSNDCFKVENILESTKVDNGCIIENRDNIKQVYINAPRNISNEINFSENPHEFGTIELASELFKQNITIPEPNFKTIEKPFRLEDNFEDVIDLRKATCAQVSVDEKLWYVFEHEFKYLVLQKSKYYFTPDLVKLVEASQILPYNLDEINIYHASFISNELFYYTTLEIFENHKNDTRCGLISVTKGEILKGDRYSSVQRFCGGKYFIVDLKYLTDGYHIKTGLIDINGNELLPPIYNDIKLITKEDNKFEIWLKKEKTDDEWFIYEQDSNNIRKAEEIDFL